MRTITLLLFLLLCQSAIGFSQTVIQMKKEGGVSVIPCKVNGLNLSFVFDTGAADVSISMTEALFMLKNDYLSNDDIKGTNKYSDATGGISEGIVINLKEIDIAGFKLYNVAASIVKNSEAPLLLGQSAIKRLGKFQLDLVANTLTITGTKNTYDASMPHKNKFVVIETTMGTIKVEVYADVKQHADNFLKLAREGFFDNILFHRVIPSFMIQAGDPKSKSASKGELLGNGDLVYKVPAEFMDQYHHRQGALAAARDNNPEKASSACQFYIVQGKTYTDSELDGIEQSLKRKMTEQARKDYKTIGGSPHLDGSYTVFGQLVEGQDVVQKITMAPRNNTDRPLEDIIIISTKIN